MASLRHLTAIVVLSAGMVNCVVSETIEIPKPSPATVRVVSVTPPAGSEITRTTTVAVELEYRVEKFERNRFQAGATAAEVRPGYAWMLTPVGGERSVLLREAAGTINVSFEAATLWEKPGLKHPFEIRFSVNQLIGTMGATVAAATSDPVIFKSAAAGR